jgi:hypothetical protein
MKQNDLHILLPPRETLLKIPKLLPNKKKNSQLPRGEENPRMKAEKTIPLFYTRPIFRPRKYELL